MSCFQELGFHWLRYVLDAISPTKLGLTCTAVHYCEIISLHLGPCNTWYFMCSGNFPTYKRYFRMRLSFLSGAYWDSYVSTKFEGDI